MKNKYTIGIIGGGFVGDILKKYYEDALVFDINGKYDRAEDVLRQEVIFIAFNITDNCRSQTSYDSVAEYAKLAPDDRIFIIKSTFIPGTTDRLQAEFPQHRFIYNPEFLTEMTAWWDFTKPHIQILGIPHQGLKLAHDIFELLPDAPIKTLISPRDAEVVKHATNSFYALKVTYFNQLSDACTKLDADYETVRDIMVKDIRVGDSHSIIHHSGYRGFGGKCLPKDVDAFEEVTEMPLLSQILDYNDSLKEAGIKSTPLGATPESKYTGLKQ